MSILEMSALLISLAALTGAVLSGGATKALGLLAARAGTVWGYVLRGAGGRRQTGPAPQEEGRHLRLLMDQIPAAVWTTDMDLRITSAMGSGLAHIRPPEDKVVGMTLYEYLKTDDPNSFPIAAHRRAIEGRAGSYEMGWKGSFYQVYLEPFFDENKRIVGGIGCALDITERRRAEEALRSSEEHLRLALSAGHMAAWYWDVLTGGTAWAGEHEQLFGIAPGGVGGTYEYFLKRVFPEDREPIVHAVTQAMQNKTDCEREFRVLWADGSVHWMLGRGRFVYDDLGRPVRMSGVMADVTERRRAMDKAQTLNVRLERRVGERTTELSALNQELKKARDAALESARIKSEFMANISHELRTPMNGILGMADLMLEADLHPQHREFMEVIHGSGTALLHLIEDILNFSKIEAGKMRLEVRDINLKALIESTVRQFTFAARDKGLDLFLPTTDDVPAAVRGDEACLRQVLSNLVSNGIKFTDRGSVTINMFKERETDSRAVLRLEVTDTGIGISPSSRANLFQPFTQADPSLTRKYGGIGLGLTIVKRLVELMKGEIGVESEPGKGSTFWCRLELEKQRPRPKAAPEVGVAFYRPSGTV